MKRYVEELIAVYAALLRDAAYAYPALSVEFERDLLRLTRLSSCRGIHYFMVDLPQLGKHLDRCVSEGQYIPSGLPTSRLVSKRVVIPVLFRGLYLLIFDNSGSLKENPDEVAYFFLRQLLLVAKKATIPCSDSATQREIEEFITVDKGLPPVSDCWSHPSQEALQETHLGFSQSEFLKRAQEKFGNERGAKILRQLDAVSSRLGSVLGPYRPEDWHFRHGPGAVSDLPFGQNRYYFPNWSERLENVFPQADCCYYNYSSWAQDSLAEARSADEPTSRLCAVPKTLTKPRLIACESSEMMWCQQNIWHYFKRRSQETWISEFVHFNDQTQNQSLALRGSRDGSLATIDLSAASDRVTPVVVGNLFRSNLGLLQALAATRTRFCEISQNGSTEHVELRKYSTMGNATTFPVESLIFLAVAITCCLENSVISDATIRSLAGKVSIFGDDIIIPTEDAGALVDLLEVLYFKVNTAKCFSTGLFRESCGVDAFRGVCVTPVYWHGPHSRAPDSYASRISTSNNFYKKFLVETARCIEHRTSGIHFPRVRCDSGVLGYNSFVVPYTGLSTRWNKGLQREETRVPCLMAVNSSVPIRDDTALLQFFTEEPEPLTKWSGGVRLRPVSKIRNRWVPTAQFARTEK